MISFTIGTESNVDSRVGDQSINVGNEHIVYTTYDLTRVEKGCLVVFSCDISASACRAYCVAMVSVPARITVPEASPTDAVVKPLRNKPGRGGIPEDRERVNGVRGRAFGNALQSSRRDMKRRRMRWVIVVEGHVETTSQRR